MGRTNDAIIYAGRVHLIVAGPAADAKSLAEQLPSSTSRDFGRPFAQLFRQFKGDFYAIDPLLFSPARSDRHRVAVRRELPRRPPRSGPARCVLRWVRRSRSGLRIALAVDGFDWHARELTRALAGWGSASAPSVCRRRCSTPRAKFGLRIRGFGADLPDGVIVRAISGGTFQAVTMRLGVLHALRELGVPVWNDARAIERCVDKSTTSFLMAKAGIPTPATWCVESLEAARALARRELANGPLVLKPLFGSQGRGLQLIAKTEDLPPPETVAGVYYLQRFVGVERDGFRDMRLFVLKGRVIAAMVRHSDSWITNVKQGGRPLAAVADGEVKALALAAAEAVGADLAGVDVVRDAHGRPLRPRGQQHAGMARAPAGDVGQYRRCDRARSGRLARSARAARGRDLSALQAEIASAFIGACLDELEAPKPGNVHVFADGHGSSVADFRRSAEVAAETDRAAGGVRRRPHPRRDRSHARRGRSKHQPRHRAAVRAARAGRGIAGGADAGRGRRRAGRAGRRGRRSRLSRDRARRARRPRTRRAP